MSVDEFITNTFGPDFVENIQREYLLELEDDATYLKVDPDDSYCVHEVFHMSSFLSSSIDNELVNHPTIISNTEWLKLAVLASAALEELYKAIGNRHLGGNYGKI